MRTYVSLVDDLTIFLSVRCKHWQTRIACSVDTGTPAAKRVLA
jgi:hypothetical protein